jgi:ABC-type multidrug transport system ATPase subunit
MPQGQVLEFSGVTKRFGGVTAVSDFTARVEPGVVTGFLGPNGAGKTTSLRMLLGLVRPTAGTATIEGVRYAKLKNPLQTVGAVLEASSFHPGRTGAGHLSVYAKAARIPKARVDEVLDLVGLSDAAGRKVGGYSLGMRQRLGLASALLGDPGVLVLDEPTNGLDPEGIKWIRGFLRQLAREGRTVFVSSHLLAEVQQTVDALLIIAGGRLVFQGGLEELADPAERATVVDSADRAALADALSAAGIPFEVLRSGLTVRGIEPVSVGLAAAAAGVPLSALHKRGPALEEIFLDLVSGARVHASASGAVFDDVIPAIESGPVTVVETVEVPDAAPAAAPEGSEPADVAEDDGVGEDDGAGEELTVEELFAGEDRADADRSGEEPAREDLAGADEAGEDRAGADEAGADEALPEADADDTESVAEEVTAAGMGAAPAAAMGAAAGMAWAETERSHDAEPSTSTASFAVASTGVIDVIPAHEAEEAAGESVEPAPADGEGDSAEWAPAEGADAEEDEFDDEPADLDDRSWEDYVKTDADLEADRFFAAFDARLREAEAERAAAEGEDGVAEAAGVPEQAEPDSAAEAEDADAEPEPDREPEPDLDPEPEPQAEPEPEPDPDGGEPASDSPEGEGGEAPQQPHEGDHEGAHDDHRDDHDGGEHR